MGKITVVFTSRKFNPVSWLIRWAVPRSRFAFGISSHCMLRVGDRAIEAAMPGGVRELDFAAATKGAHIVKITHYQVPDEAAGIAWARAQIGKSYDWPGAIGLGLTPGRDWRQDDKWFCYEFAGATLAAAGRPVFASLTHVGETALMAINP